MALTAGDARFEAEIRRTTHGVAHIRGATLGDVGFGQGYACAADHLPTIADQIVKVRGERSAFFGAGPDDVNIDTDIGYAALGVREWAERMAATCPADTAAVVDGYATGINRWLEEHGTSDLPPWCRDAPWIRAVDVVDLFTLFADASLMGSGRNLVAHVGSAQPPPGHPERASTGAVMPPDLPGSNGWAFGADATAHGGGMVVANPHFPWFGDGRFWECHLTIPGDLDVYGVALVGTPGVQMGFNRDVAWTHTFSRGHRFVVYRLDLVPGEPTAYRFGDERREMTSSTVEIAVASEDGATTAHRREVWRSHHGPMVDIPLLGWGDTHAFTYRDANLDNDRFLEQYLSMNRARSVGDVREAIRTHQGCPWVNVIAADAHGDVYYSDPSPTPNLAPEAEKAYERDVDEDLLTALFASQRVALLDGSEPATTWVDDPSSLQAGCVGPERWPEMLCRDLAFNSNDPYWVAHPRRFLDRGPTLSGLYGRGLSPRTRMNAAVLDGRAPSGPGDGRRWTASDAETALLDNRSLLAEELLDDVIDRLRDTAGTAGVPATLSAVADLLAAWDRTFDLDSVGAVLWREFLAHFTEDELRTGGRLFAQPFDVTDPTRTPRGLAPAPSEGTDPIIEAVESAVQALSAAGIPLDAPLGEVQFIDRGGARIGLHGANEVEGIVNVVAPIGAFVRSDLEPPVPVGEDMPGHTERTGLRRGGYPITYGASFLMICELGESGPRARGLLAYGQSGDPRSPHHVDQTRAFAAKALRPLLFDEAEIASNSDLEVRRIRS